MPLGEVAAVGLSDSGDRQVPPRGAVAFWLGGGGGFGIGGDRRARSLRRAWAELAQQVVLVVMVVSRCHSGSSTVPRVRCREQPGPVGSALTWASRGTVPAAPQFIRRSSKIVSVTVRLLRPL